MPSPPLASELLHLNCSLHAIRLQCAKLQCEALLRNAACDAIADEARRRSHSTLLRLRVAVLRSTAGFNPDQPRVPAGNPEGGQWTSGGGGRERIRLAAADRPILGSAGRALIVLELAKRVIEGYRSDNLLSDIFGHKIGTVTTTDFKGETLFGSNSTSPTYTNADRDAASRLRSVLLERYSDMMDVEYIGRKPNDAVFHAETTILLRAAEKNGGTLAGMTLEIFGDRPLCSSCRIALPRIGVELGNPTVTFVDGTGLRMLMRDGKWQ